MTLLESIGIIFGLIFTGFGLIFNAVATFRSISSSKLSNYQEITKSHRELWKMTLDEPVKYARVIEQNPNIERRPVTYHEHRFVHLLLLHMTTAYNFSKYSHLIEIEKMEHDIGEFINLPIPKFVWEQNKLYFNEDFKKFVQGAIDKNHMK